MPWFWSDQYDRKIQLAGRSGADDDVEVVIGSIEEHRFVALYGREGRVVGVLGMNRPRHVMQLRALVEEPTPWADGLTRPARSPEPRPPTSPTNLRRFLAAGRAFLRTFGW